jgi:hypothetical protein
MPDCLIELQRRYDKNKLQRWCGFPGKNASKAAPVLEFSLEAPLFTSVRAELVEAHMM